MNTYKLHTIILTHSHNAWDIRMVITYVLLTGIDQRSRSNPQFHHNQGHKQL